MKSFSETVFAENEQVALAAAIEFVEMAPYEYQGKLIRCHELALAVGHMLGLPVMSGFYGKVDHSWLYFKNEKILDVYAIGSLPQVRLVDTSWSLPDCYFPGYPRDDIKQDVVEHLIGLMNA